MASIDGFQQQVKQDKWFRNLEDDMKLIIPYIEDKRVTDIAIGIGGNSRSRRPSSPYRRSGRTEMNRKAH